MPRALERYICNRANQRGTAEQHFREGKNAIKRTLLSCWKFRNIEAKLRLHVLAFEPRQLNVDAGVAEGSGTLVVDHAAGEVSRDQSQGPYVTI